MEDECTLVKLKWKAAEVRKAENKSRSNRKKTHCCSAPEPPNHRYNTRYAAEVAMTRTASYPDEVTALQARVRRMEGRVEGMKQEVEDIKVKMTRILALEPQITELAAQVTEHYKQQANMNSILLSEITMLKHAVTPVMEDKIKRQAVDITTLTQRFNQLYMFAMTLFYLAQAAAYRYRTANQSNFENINVPVSRGVRCRVWSQVLVNLLD